MIRRVKRKLHLCLAVALFTAFGFHGCVSDGSQNKISGPYLSVPMGGNSWVVDMHHQKQDVITTQGIVNWSDPQMKIRTWFKVDREGEIFVALRANGVNQKSKIKITLDNESKEVTINNSQNDTISVGRFTLKGAGYHYVELQGVSRKGEQFANVSDLLIAGTATQGKVQYVKDEFYWGRRGPSVHLGYQLPTKETKAVWFYNEVTVPEGNDVMGSYFMANGFGQGYFGMQVNSSTERRILFSVWSPFKTDNPKEIPEDMRIKMLKKGKDVHTGKFGNEGSGGQSFYRYNWKAGSTYRFLLKGVPVKNRCTEYTAYFYAPEVGQWKLIASFRRPQTHTYLTHLHSFLENFIPDMGATNREVRFSNQWICDVKGQWTQLDKARFTADATARKEARMDYSGGAKQQDFFLTNCGFFDDQVTIGTIFTRELSDNKPHIDFSQLP